MNNVFQQFAELLDQKLQLRVSMTEDYVRKEFCGALLANRFKKGEIILEFPHPVIAGAKIDIWAQSRSVGAVAIEFKYDRGIPSGKNQPRPQKAGDVFKDIHRLSLVRQNTDAVAYFVYLTDNEMGYYFNNPANGHEQYFSLPVGQKLEINSAYFESKPKTFMNRIGGEFETLLVAELSREMANSHFLRIYQIKQ